MALLEVHGLQKRLGRRWVLGGVTFALEPGEGLCVLGPNGSGKTTLLNCLATLWRPTAGQILWEGADVFAQRQRYRRQIGYLAHRSMLYLEWSARENLHFFGRLYALSDLDYRVEVLLELVGLKALADEPAGVYSRGMLQRLAIARALLPRPRLLLLDEPFSGLDATTADRLLGFLQKERQRGTALVVVTHTPELGRTLSDQVIHLAFQEPVRAVRWERP